MRVVHATILVVRTSNADSISDTSVIPNGASQLETSNVWMPSCLIFWTNMADTAIVESEDIPEIHLWAIIFFEKKIRITPVINGISIGKSKKLIIAIHSSQFFHIVRAKFLVGTIG